MPHNDKLFRDAIFGADFTPKGIEETMIRKSDSYYQDPNHPENTPDPLAKSARAANKPGSSIPSVFGRMMFFKTALKNARIHGGHNVIPSVYDKIVSQWLDLLQGIFMRSHNYTFTVWNREDQLERLKSGHDVLHDAIETQINKYFGDKVRNIYIIKDKSGNLVGATSPYTLVFTSPNFSKKADNEILPLIARDRKFRLFMYSIYSAIKRNPKIPRKVAVKVNTQMGVDYVQEDNPSWKMLSDLCTYLERNLALDDSDIKKAIAADTVDNLERLGELYAPIEAEYNGVTSVIDIVNLGSVSQTRTGDVNFDAGFLNLYARKASEIESDFFVDPDEGVNGLGEDLPMILPNVKAPKERNGVSYPNMKYIDEKNWSEDALRGGYYKLENYDEKSEELPMSNGIRYKWLSVAAFMENRLIELPYPMDENNFIDVINIGHKSYLLPIKPKLFKFFRLHTILNGRQGQGSGFSYSYDEKTGKLKCCLDIPVKNNSGDKKSYVTLVREYLLNGSEDVVSASPLEDFPVSVGITPFFKLDFEMENRYDVMLHTGELGEDPVQAVKLQFYNGSEVPFMGREGDDERQPKPVSATVRQTLYKILGRTFDAMRVVFDCVSEGKVGGFVIPNWRKPVTNDKVIFYAVDFGTTNSHIAFVETGVDAKSFGHEQLKNQVVYLAKKENISDKSTYLTYHSPEQLKKACELIYGDQSRGTQEAQARNFFPNFELDEFSFPIRTAAYGNADANTELFDGFSIGFFYPQEQERVYLENYNTKLKWNLERSATKSDTEALLFFKELLLIIRNHWIGIQNVKLEAKPRIALTFPLAMNAGNLMNLWQRAYAEVFGVTEADAGDNYLIEVSESLAPAHKLISGGAHTSSGLLNVDIGGGTTDIQYYRESGGRTLAYYNSERFAGDDLWGCGRENMGVETTIVDNVFTRFADKVMAKKLIQVGSKDVTYEKLEDLKGKEKIGRLLRDTNIGNFASQLTHATVLGRNTAALRVVFLHYSAIIYHIAKWVMSNPRMKQKFPELINFSGFGSKYINILFGEGKTDDLTNFTREMLIQYGVEDLKDENSKFEVRLEKDNPKGITAEGAAIYAKNKIGKTPVVTPTKAYYFGYAGSDSRNSPTYGEAESEDVRGKILEAFDEYLEGFCKVQAESNLDIPSITPDEKNKFKENAKRSYDQVTTDFLNGPAALRDIKVLQSLFFWTLKDSLYNFDL